MFKENDHDQLFLDYLDNKHSDIKFICKHELHNKFSFVGINISHEMINLRLMYLENQFNSYVHYLDHMISASPTYLSTMN